LRNIARSWDCAKCRLGVRKKCRGLPISGYILPFGYLDMQLRNPSGAQTLLFALVLVADAALSIGRAQSHIECSMRMRFRSATAR